MSAPFFTFGSDKIMVSKQVLWSLYFGLVLVAGCSRQQSDWQKTRETNTAEAYELFLKKYPQGEFTAQAQAQVKQLDEERDWQKARDADTPEAYQSFLKQYTEGKLAEEARIRVENFTLAQAPGAVPANSDGTVAANSAVPDDAAPASPPSSAAPGTSGAPAVPSSAAPSIAAGLPARAAKTVKPPVTSPVHAPSRATSSPLTTHAPTGGGHYGIQLGAFKTDRSAAVHRWARLQKAYPSVLGGLSSTVLPKQASTGNWYRLQAVGLSEKHARSICSSLKAQSEACIVVRPTAG